MSVDPYTILRHEFNGEDGSFLIRLRCDLYWDAAAFQRLTQAMFQVAAACEDRDQLPKWIAQGFWYAETFARDWTAHPNFPRQPGVNYTEGCELLYCLSSYLFNGFSPLEDGQLAAWVGQD